MAARENRVLNRELWDSRRTAKSLSVERLARAADVSNSTAQAADRGAVVGPESRRRLAGALEVAEDALWLAYAPEASRSHG